MTPLETNLLSRSGEVNGELNDYYKQRAKGGTGPITTAA